MRFNFLYLGIVDTPDKLIIIFNKIDDFKYVRINNKLGLLPVTYLLNCLIPNRKTLISYHMWGINARRHMESRSQDLKSGAITTRPIGT